MSSGANNPSPPPSIMAGPPMPMFESAVAMIVSQQPSSAALPAKHLPERCRRCGTTPDSRANSSKARVEARDDGHVGVAGSAAAALGEEHDRDAERSMISKIRSFLRVVAVALCAGQHRVVVGDDRAARARSASTMSELTRAIPVMSPSAGVFASRSSGPSAAWAAKAKPPYSSKLPGSTSAAMFSRAVRWPRARRLATASGRASSPSSARRRCSSARSVRAASSFGSGSPASVSPVAATM